MAYPNAEDYVRAVQQPERVFRRPELHNAVFALHPRFGIPMPASGNAAVVFKAGVAGEDAALRFFIREDASSRERYTALGRHFTDRGIDGCVAHAQWIDDAIDVNGSTWPMIQMNWVDGRTLDAYVGHLAETANVRALSYLADAWRKFIARVQAAEFAHGDLQHGNVLVDMSSTLRLVDIDGSWIPAFQGTPPPAETGHPNYQRTGREWGRWMDTFPGLVIYTALLALAQRPDSWATLHNGENILFSAEDFTPPFRTRTWQLLSSIVDAEVGFAAHRLKLACDPAWRAEDTLESLLTASAPAQIMSQPSTPATPFPGVGAPTTDAARWWEHTAAPAGMATGAPAGTAPSVPSMAPPSGYTMPPPPPMSGPGSPQQQPMPFMTGPAGAWYPPIAPVSPWPVGGGSAPAPWPPPSQRGHRLPGGVIALLVFLIAAVAGLLGAAIGAGAGGNPVATALVFGLIAAGIALPLLLRRKQ